MKQVLQIELDNLHKQGPTHDLLKKETIGLDQHSSINFDNFQTLVAFSMRQQGLMLPPAFTTILGNKSHDMKCPLPISQNSTQLNKCFICVVQNVHTATLGKISQNSSHPCIKQGYFEL